MADSIDEELEQLIRDVEGKPLSALYGPGTGLATFDIKDEALLPLLQSIEEVIVTFCDAASSVPSGGSILLTVK